MTLQNSIETDYYLSGRTDMYVEATCPECGRHHYVNGLNPRKKCPYCVANPLPPQGYGPKTGENYLKWVLVEDKGPKDCRFKPGARFATIEIEQMQRMGTISPGSRFKNIKTKKIWEIKEARNDRD